MKYLLILLPIFSYGQNSLFYDFGMYMTNVHDIDGRVPVTFEIGADMQTYTVSLQSDVRKGRTYISNFVSKADQISIDTRYVINGKLNNNHLLGGYGQFTTTAMAVDGAAIGLSYRYIQQNDRLSFYADALVPFIGYNKIRKWNSVDERVNSIVLGHNLNPNYKARNTEYRIKVGLIYKVFVQ